MIKYLLLDNGSLRPAATLTLRRLARALGQLARVEVDAVSLQHADKIDAVDLNGERAWILRDYLSLHLQNGCRQFVVVPLFFGLSRAITSLIPDIREQLEAEFGEFHLQLCDLLYPLNGDDGMLAQILLRNITGAAGETMLSGSVVLVDHGSPSPRVNEVRQCLARDLQQRLGAHVMVEQAVMERRKGRKYDFNGDLLEDWLLEKATSGQKVVVVSLMFLLPGRHAGAGGDIESICQRVMQLHPQFHIHLTPLISDNPDLIELLYQRLKDCLDSTGD